MDTGKKVYTFSWYIENYSYCWHKTGEKLISPEFSADSLEGTAWSLHLYPREEIFEYKWCISLYLGRSKDDGGPKNASVKFELSVHTADGSTLTLKEYEYDFIKGIGYGSPKFLQMNEVILYRAAKYLPQDILTVRCRIWQGEGAMQQQAQIYARTRIGIEHISFFHLTENFSTLGPNDKETRDIPTTKKGRVLSCSLYLSDYPSSENIMVQIKPSDKNHKFARCKLSILDKSGSIMEYGEMDHWLGSDENTVQALTLTRIDILSKKSEYLPNDKLSLLCEYSFSTGVEYEKIEKIVLRKPFVNTTDNRCYKNDTDSVCQPIKVIDSVCNSVNVKDSVCRIEVILKCLFVAIFSCFFGIFMSYLVG